MMMPFSPEGGAALVLSRAAAVAALLSLFGSLTFRVFVVPRALARAGEDIAARVRQRLLTVAQVSVAAALAGLGLWLLEQTADMANDAFVAGALAAVPAVLRATAFGHLVILQAAALLACALAIGRRDQRVRQWLAAGFAAVATGLQAGHGHAASMVSGPSVLLAADLVHLWAAGLWLGGLLPLLVVVRVSPALVGAAAARWYSPLGKLAVVAVAASAAYQGWVLVESIPGLVGTAFGWMAIVKTGLLSVLFGFAILNRYWLAPALLRDGADAAKRRLVRSIAIQTGVGLAIVAAAAVLASLPPAMHEQAVWPFALQPSLVTLNEDPAFKREVVTALLELGAAALVLALALAVRRWRIAAGLACAAVAWLAVPHLDLLFIPAYPTSFFQSPTAFAATSIVRGAALYPDHCAACHGASGHGDGPASAGLPVPPADLTAEHLWAHSDGELFWWLSHGIAAPDGGLAMPGFAGVLLDDDLWALIDYVRAHNAGRVYAATGDWSPPLAAPELTADCPGGKAVNLADLRGHAVRLIFSGGPSPAAASAAGVTTITVGPSGRGCVASDPAIPAAYATVLGTTEAALAGSELFIDPNGWLRSDESGPVSPAALAALVQEICRHPLSAAPGGHHHHVE